MDEQNKHDIQTQQFVFQKASVTKRFCAFLIDFCAFLHLSFILDILLIFGVNIIGNPNEVPARLYFLYFIIVLFFVYCGFRDAVNGQSIGKIALGIGVRDDSDNYAVPRTLRLFWHQIFSFIGPIEFLILVLSSEKRKLGDRVARTDVYSLKEYKRYLRQTRLGQNTGHLKNTKLTPHIIEPYKPNKIKVALLVTGVLLVIVIFFAAFIFGIFALLRSHASFHVATEYIKGNPEITTLIGEVESVRMTSGNVSGGTRAGDAHGNSSFGFRVRGAYGDTRVFVELEMRDGGDWEITRFIFVEIE